MKPAAESATADLVGRARVGEQAAFTALYRRFLPLVHGLLLARHPPPIADELSQDCFATAFAQLQQLRDAERFGPWIARIARHQRAREHRTLPLEAVAEARAHGADHEQQHEARSVLAALQRLPMAYRETLMLRLAEGLSEPEIAAHTGLSADSVRVNLHRGMRKLRALLALTDDGPPAPTAADDTAPSQRALGAVTREEVAHREVARGDRP